MEAIFRGASGRLHRFQALRPGPGLPGQAGVYMFARPSRDGLAWTPLYLSRTSNLERRFEGHERWQEARMLGATHVLVHTPEARDAREAVEADLMFSLRPVLNGPFEGGAGVVTPLRRHAE